MNRSNYLFTQNIATPIGQMLAVVSDAGVCLLEFVGQNHLEREIRQITQTKNTFITQQHHDLFYLLNHELNAYFSGSLKTFSIPLDIVGTDFQKSVWHELQKIPYGSTLSYSEQAHNLGKPKAVRAVAAANSQNKISLIIPCHRVIGKNGSLTGYAGGLSRKQFLLNLEQQTMGFR